MEGIFLALIFCEVTRQDLDGNLPCMKLLESFESLFTGNYFVRWFIF